MPPLLLLTEGGKSREGDGGNAVMVVEEGELFIREGCV